MFPNKQRLQQFPRYLFLTVFLFIIFLPILGIILSAFKTDAEVVQGPFALPQTIQFKAFIDAWKTGNFSLYFRSSVIVTISVVLFSVFLSILTGYGFGVMNFPAEKYLYTLILVGYMVPFEAVIIPLYHFMHGLGLTNTYWALILPQIGLSLSFGTLWMTNFFKAAPRELMDAAAIDGCNRWQTLWKILWPLAQPAVLTLIVLIFMWTWNEFLLALVMVQDEALRTLPVGLAFFQGRHTSDIPLMSAGSIIVAGPIVLVYILFQRYFIRGMLSGSVKG